MKKTLLLLVTVLQIWAQNKTFNINATFKGSVDASGATSVLPFALKASNPPTCSPGTVIVRSDQTYGQNVYICGTSNNWVLISGSGGGIISVGGSNPVVSSGGATPNVSCPTCVTSSTSLASLSIVSGAGSQGSQATNITTDSALNNLTVPGTITTGDGTTAGELYMYELTANGSQYFSWLGQNLRATTLRAQIPSADPAAGQVMLFSAPSSTISTATWGSKLTTPSSNGLVSSTGSDASAGRTLTGTANQIAITNGDGTVGNPTFALDSIVDLTAKTATRPVKAGTSAAAPSSCQANNDLYIKTDATAGQQLFICNSTGNGWVLLGDGTTGAAAKYANSFTSQTAITILGTTHNLGSADLQVTIYDNSSPRKQIEADTVTINTATFDVAIAFATPQSGRYVIQ